MVDGLPRILVVDDNDEIRSLLRGVTLNQPCEGEIEHV
jgi:hypothetical protein